MKRLIFTFNLVAISHYEKSFCFSNCVNFTIASRLFNTSAGTADFFK